MHDNNNGGATGDVRVGLTALHHKPGLRCILVQQETTVSFHYRFLSELSRGLYEE